jgi:Putative Actinobacterial Holin-X, holin superfamily III
MTAAYPPDREAAYPADRGAAYPADRGAAYPADREEAYPPDREEDKSIGQLIGDISNDLSRLFRQEIELAKAEVRQEASKAGKAAGMLGGAGLAGYLVVLFLSFALMFGLGNVMDLGWAALIVAVIWAVIGAVLYVTGRRRIKEVSPVPRQTVETLKEDAEWLKNPTG